MSVLSVRQRAGRAVQRAEVGVSRVSPSAGATALILALAGSLLLKGESSSSLEVPQSWGPPCALLRTPRWARRVLSPHLVPSPRLPSGRATRDPLSPLCPTSLLTPRLYSQVEEGRPPHLPAQPCLDSLERVERKCSGCFPSECRSPASASWRLRCLFLSSGSVPRLFKSTSKRQETAATSRPQVHLSYSLPPLIIPLQEINRLSHTHTPSLTLTHTHSPPSGIELLCGLAFRPDLERCDTAGGNWEVGTQPSPGLGESVTPQFSLSRRALLEK